MSKVVIFKHPLIESKLSIIRDKNTGIKEFKRLVDEVAMLMTYEITKNLKMEEVEIETPICKMKTHRVSQGVVLVPILRAGLGFLEGFHSLIDDVEVGFIGMARDEVTHEPEEYFVKLPNLDGKLVICLDPMLATGGSATDAIYSLKRRGAKEIIYAGLVGAQEGIDKLQKNHPDVDIYLAALDEGLNENCYIVPGLGDCGDRLFGKPEESL